MFLLKNHNQVVGQMYTASSRIIDNGLLGQISVRTAFKQKLAGTVFEQKPAGTVF